MKHRVEHDKSGKRFTVSEEGYIAEQTCQIQEQNLYIMNTEVPDAIGGRGVAKDLIESTLNYARENKYKVTVFCPFAKTYLKRHSALKEGVEFQE